MLLGAWSAVALDPMVTGPVGGALGVAALGCHGGCGATRCEGNVGDQAGHGQGI